MNSLAFFNNKGGVGKTSLVYHLAWMFSLKGIEVVVADLDPQANLTSMFLEDERLLEIWQSGTSNTILDHLQPLIDGSGDIRTFDLEPISSNLHLIPGNLGLTLFEDSLSENWAKCLGKDARAFRVMTAFYRIIAKASSLVNAQLVLLDVAPSLGAINRSALIAANQVIFPLAPDLFSLQGLKNLGPTLSHWRIEWKKRLNEVPTNLDIPMPEGKMNPMGYVVMQFGVKDNRPVKAYEQFLNQIPTTFHDVVLGESIQNSIQPSQDPYQLIQLKHYRSLMPLAMKARKPMFLLTPKDGAIGAHLEAVRRCYQDFEQLAKIIASKAGIPFS